MRRLLPILLLGLACNPKEEPDEVERCDGIDNDGNGVVDDGFDRDSDGFLAEDAGCAGLGLPLDCDDGDATVNPAALDDDCDGEDDDCNGVADQLADHDGDGFWCEADCDDDDRDAWPGALEACDGKDNNCDGVADEEWDEDGDGASPCGGDCNERDPLQGPLQPEICDGLDNNCDGTTDEGFDQDGDGQATCEGDCDDTRATVHVGAEEICDDLDTDCDGHVQDRNDADEDGYTICDGDCQEGEARAHPGATESCDALDNDCDGGSDNIPECHDCEVFDDLWICEDLMQWPDARDVCAAMGGALAMIGDEATNQLLLDQAAAGGTTYWIGVTDDAVEGTWLYVDGTAVTWFGWATANPSDRNGTEDCVWVNSSGWSDNRCTSRPGFACQF